MVMFLCRSLENSFLRHEGRQLCRFRDASLVQDLQGNSPAPSAFFARAAERGKKFAKLKWNSGSLSLSQTKEANFGGIQGQRDGRKEEGGKGIREEEEMKAPNRVICDSIARTPYPYPSHPPRLSFLTYLPRD